MNIHDEIYCARMSSSWINFGVNRVTVTLSIVAKRCKISAGKLGSLECLCCCLMYLANRSDVQINSTLRRYSCEHWNNITTSDINQQQLYISDRSANGNWTRPPAEVGRKQNWVLVARLRSGARQELWNHTSRMARRTVPQSLHVQLGTQVNEHRYSTWPWDWWLPVVHKRSIRDRSKKVRIWYDCDSCQPSNQLSVL